MKEGNNTRRSLVMGAGALALAPRLAFSQDKYPSRPVEFIVPWGAGGGADQLARRTGKLLEGDLKVSVPVVNVPGATGNTGMAKLLAAAPDGYSISIMTWDTYALLATTPSTRWSLKDIIPVALMIKQPSAFMTAANGNLKTWADVEREAGTLLHELGFPAVHLPDDVPDDDYDLCLLADVIEHVGDVVAFLESMQRYRFRQLVVATPNAFRLRNFLSRGELINTDHRYWFSPYTLCKVLADAGYAPQRVELCHSDYVSGKGALLARVLDALPKYRDTLIVTASR